MRIEGYTDRIITTGTFSKCIAECEKESKFPCLSAEYRPSVQNCRLSTAIKEIVELTAWGSTLESGTSYAERICA